MVLSGNYSVPQTHTIAVTEWGFRMPNGTKMSRSTFYAVVTNPFYYGLMKYNNELHQGKHKSMITKKLFEKCQKILRDRTRPKKKSFKEYAFRGLLKCAECGCSITSEIQKGHTYYRCTKKRMSCSQSYIREENLAEQISKILQKVSLSSAPSVG